MQPSPDFVQQATSIAIQDFFKAYQSNPTLMMQLDALTHTEPALLEGDYHQRATSDNGIDFHFADLNDGAETYVLAWSRILDGTELLCAVNFHDQNQQVVYVTIDNELHRSGSQMRSLLALNGVTRELNVEDRNGKCVQLRIPPRALLIYK